MKQKNFHHLLHLLTKFAQSLEKVRAGLRKIFSSIFIQFKLISIHIKGKHLHCTILHTFLKILHTFGEKLWPFFQAIKVMFSLMFSEIKQLFWRKFYSLFDFRLLCESLFWKWRSDYFDIKMMLWKKLCLKKLLDQNIFENIVKRKKALDFLEKMDEFSFDFFLALLVATF